MSERRRRDHIRSRSPVRTRSRSPVRVRTRSHSRSPVRRLVRDPTKFGLGLEIEFNTINLCADSYMPDWMIKTSEFVDGDAIYKKNKLQITTEKSQTKVDCFDIEAQIGVFNSFSVVEFNTSCDELKVLLNSLTQKECNENGKPQLTLSFHISKYPAIFLFYFKDQPYYKRLYDAVERMTDDPTIFGFVLYTSYYFIKIQYYIQLYYEEIKRIKRLENDITRQIDIENKKNKQDKNIKLITELTAKRFKLLGIIRSIDLPADNFHRTKVSIFKAYLDLKPRTSIYDVFSSFSKPLQDKIKKEVDFNFIKELAPSTLNFKDKTTSELAPENWWTIDDPQVIFKKLDKTPANKIGGLDLPLNEVFDFCTAKYKTKPWAQQLIEDGIEYKSTNFVDVGGPEYIAIEFRNFKKLAKLSADDDREVREGMKIEEFKTSVGEIMKNFIKPIFTVSPSLFKNKKSKNQII